MEPDGGSTMSELYQIRQDWTAPDKETQIQNNQRLRPLLRLGPVPICSFGFTQSFWKIRELFFWEPKNTGIAAIETAFDEG